MTRLRWYLKQLLPLTYRSTYHEFPDGSNSPAGCRKHFAVWKMWMGQTYKSEDYVVD